MGTIIARNLMQSQSWDYEKVIMSGFPCSPGRIALDFGIILTQIVKKVKGARYYSEFIQNISVGSFNKKIKNPGTSLDWISINKENIDYTMLKTHIVGMGLKYQHLMICSICLKIWKKYGGIKM